MKRNVGVVRDQETKLEDDEVSHTLGGTGEGTPKEWEEDRRREDWAEDGPRVMFFE